MRQCRQDSRTRVFPKIACPRSLNWSGVPTGVPRNAAAGRRRVLAVVRFPFWIQPQITMSIELKAMLDRYADLHAQAWSEPVDVPMLIPHMLAAFMERDRGFKALFRKP